MPKKGYKQTEEHKINAVKGQFQRGHLGHWKNKKRQFSESHKINMSHPHKKHKKFERGKQSLVHRQNISNSLRGYKNPNWKGGISLISYSINWTETLKRSIRERDKYICQYCGEQQGNKGLSVHHINYDKKDCNPKNLITLCQKCHARTNFKRDYWIKYLQLILEKHNS